jgi:hypothetical protein
MVEPATRDPAADGRSLGHFHGAARTVFHAHADLINSLLAHPPFYGVAGETTAQRTGNGAKLKAVAQADPVAQHRAQQAAGDGSDADSGRPGRARDRRDRLNRTADPGNRRGCDKGRCRAGRRATSGLPLSRVKSVDRS